MDNHFDAIDSNVFSVAMVLIIFLLLGIALTLPKSELKLS